MNQQSVGQNSSAFTELNLKIIMKQLSEQPGKLDFSSSYYSLIRIGFFNHCMESTCDQVLELNLNDNRLKQIDSVDNFQKLKVLSVQRNMLTKVKVDLPQLQILDLSYNQLTQFPNLSKLDSLIELNLSFNRISELTNQSINQLQKKIKMINISNNQIQFSEGNNIRTIILELDKTYKDLTHLNIEGNPFLLADQKLVNYFAMGLQSLSMLNGKPAEQMRQELNQGKEHSRQYLVDELENLELQQSFILDDEEALNLKKEITLKSKQLLQKIEKCIEDPSKCIDQIEHLSDLVQKIVGVPEKWGEYFTNEDIAIQRQIEEELDNFLQGCLLFSQNQQNYIRDIMVILAQLAVIPQLQFGRKSFELLVETIRTGKGMEKIAKEILRDYSVPLIQKNKNIEDMPTFVMEGILKSIQERHDFNLVPLDIVTNLSGYLEQILKAYCVKRTHVKDEEQTRDILVLLFCAELASSHKSKFLKEFTKNGVIMKCIQLFKMIMKTEFIELYISVLQVLYNCAVSSDELAKEIIKSRETQYNYVRDLQDELKYNIFVFKKFRNSMANPETKESRQYILLKYQKFGILIKCYGSVMGKMPGIDQNKIKGDTITQELLQLISIQNIHPFLMTGLVIFVRMLLQNPCILKEAIGDPAREQDSIETVSYIANKIENGIPILHCLGGDSYVLMMKQLDPSNSTKITRNLSTQVNPAIHEMFQSIVQLIRFFTQNAIYEESPIGGICLEISSNLDINGRDEALFIALATPNDDVRLEIVQCLLTIKISELDSKELAKLVALLSSYKNLGAGQTESVISTIMMILTKIVVGEQKEAFKDFTTIYSENAIMDSLDILVRNMERDLRLDEDENEQKIELACGVVNFLKSLSTNHDLRRTLKGLHQSKCLKSALLNEENLLKPEDVSVEIERTWTGKFCEYLIACLFGKESLLPYTKISDRVLLRIADNLQNCPEDKPEDLKDKDLKGLYDAEKILKKIQLFDEKRRNSELELWHCMIHGDSTILTEYEGDTLLYIDSQHALMLNTEAATNLLQYLLGRNHSPKTMVYADMFMEMFNGRCAYEKYLQQLDQQIYELIEDAIAGTQQSKKKVKLQTTNRSEIYEQLICCAPNPTDPLRGFLKENPLFDLNKSILYPVVQIQKSAVTKETSERDDQLYGKVRQLIPPEKRVITICAYLRIVFALLAYSPQGKTGKKIAIQISTKNEYLRDLTLICEWADWSQGNIASKYLKIINFVLENSNHCQSDQFLTGYLIICQGALQQILKIVDFKLQNEDKTPLQFQDKILIMECCECMGKIIKNLNKMNLAELSKDELEQMANEIKDLSQNQILEFVDQKLREHILINYMPLQSFKVYIEIMIWDMRETSKLSKELIAEKRVTEIKANMRKWLVLLLGQYIVQCRSLRQDILQSLINVEIFKKKYIRFSFIQDILDQTFDSNFEAILKKNIKKENFYKFKKGVIEDQIIINCFARCFHFNQENKKSRPVILAFVNTDFLIIDYKEHDKKGDDIYSNDYITFSVFKEELKIDCKLIEGIYQMESSQRVCVLYSKKSKAEDYNDPNLLALFFVFPKLKMLEDIKETCVRKKIKFGFDLMSLKSLSKQLSSFGTNPDLVVWASIDPAAPVIDRLGEFNKNRYLVIIIKKEIILMRDRIDQWYFTQGKNQTVMTTVAKEYQKLSEKDIQKATIDKIFFLEKQIFELDKLSSIQIEQTLNPVMTLVFGKKGPKLRILFGCENAREKFKLALIALIPVDQFKDVQKHQIS